ncbi:hypothetical protein MXB_4628 [Myxobolus squamalis]|nr:hypothetical protein MXB_4628 [Myxobolus squamalis]
MKYLLFLIVNLIIKYRALEDHSDLTSVQWPGGTYGLPEPNDGCPKDGSWKTGFVYQNTEDDMNTNSHSSSFHGKGRFTDKGIELRFCIQESNEINSTKWPNGSYCLYKYKKCPIGFEEGEDEKSIMQIPNQEGGILPDGVYNLTTTLIKFCCINTGDPAEAIKLPTDYPFYLFPATEKCQQIINMEMNEEWIHFDDDDEGNTDYTFGRVPYGINPQVDYNIILKLCYYVEKIEIHNIINELKMKQETNGNATIFKKNAVIGASILSGGLLMVGVGIATLIKYKTLNKLMP